MDSSKGPAEGDPPPSMPSDAEGPEPERSSTDPELPSAEIVPEDSAPAVKPRAKRRWFDHAYTALDWLPRHRSVWRRIPRRGQLGLTRALNYLLPYQEHQRQLSKEYPAFGKVEIPDDEHVRMLRLWAVEFYTPSEHDNLQRSLSRHSWEGPERDRENEGRLEQSRSHAGMSWWRIGGVKRINSGFFRPGFHEGRLAPCFGVVSLSGYQVGSGTTAIVAEFYLTDSAMEQVDWVWRTDHQPELVKRRGMRPLAEDGAWVAMRKTQAARRALHDAARDWMAENLPGAFASRGRRHPVFDVLLFDVYSPLTAQRPSVERSDALRALGITRDHIRVTSESLPGFVLHQTEQALCPALGDAPSWGLMGNMTEVPDSMLRGRGSDKPYAIAGYIDDVARPFFVSIALSHLLKEIEKSYAQLRDSARSQQRKLKGKYAERLQEGLITLSLDISALARDVKAVHQYGWWTGEATFTMAYAPWAGLPSRSVEYNRTIADEQLQAAVDLSEADREYREVLTAVSALGASVDAFRLSRLALWVAAATLLLTAVILMITDVGDHTIWHWLAERQ